MKYQIALSVFVGTALLTLPGCASSGVSGENAGVQDVIAWEDWRPEEPPILQRTMNEAEKMQFRELDLEYQKENLLSQWGVEVDEFPPLVRWTDYSEGPRVWVECLIESGWAASYLEGGGVEAPKDLALEQQSAYLISQFDCYAKYSRDPNQAQPLSPSQKGVLYDYMVEWWIPCVESQGYGFTMEIPTREAYISSNDWDPWAYVTSPKKLRENSEEAQTLLRECPRIPPDAAMYPY